MSTGILAILLACTPPEATPSDSSTTHESLTADDATSEPVPTDSETSAATSDESPHDGTDSGESDPSHSTTTGNSTVDGTDDDDDTTTTGPEETTSEADGTQTATDDDDDPGCPSPDAAGPDVTIVDVDGNVEASLPTDSTLPDTAEAYCMAPADAQKSPVVMVPGLGLSHYMYMATPDRRASFAEAFVAAGHPVHVLNPRQNEISAQDGSDGDGLSRWGVDRFWSRWGFGPEPEVAHENVRFPVEAMDDFIDHMPLWRSGAGNLEAELEALLEAVGSATLIVHSAAGPAGFAVSRRRPELVEALVVLEPTGCPENSDDAPVQPFIAVYGDYIASRRQGSRLAACRTTVELVESAGIPAELLSYPDMQVMGNTHLMTQDDNNDAIAHAILERLTRRHRPHAR